jgi:tRNA pseudouridine38-40 synthase
MERKKCHMKRILLRVSYEGTAYCGWQLQPNGNTIEAELNYHLSQLLGEEIQVIGASRTDAGVHALGNVAVFDTQARMPAEKFVYALNQRLPEDIVVQSSCQVPDQFHPRHCASRKTYEYRILNREFPLPMYRNFAYFTYEKLDVEAMRNAGSFFLGEQDFKAVCSTKTQAATTVREIYSLCVKQEDPFLLIRVEGNGFLYNMVRILAGTLLEVGRHKYPPEHVKEILAGGDRSAAGPTAPACGLTLLHIAYPDLKLL